MWKVAPASIMKRMYASNDVRIFCVYVNEQKKIYIYTKQTNTGNTSLLQYSKTEYFPNYIHFCRACHSKETWFRFSYDLFLRFIRSIPLKKQTTFFLFSLPHSVLPLIFFSLLSSCSMQHTPCSLMAYIRKRNRWIFFLSNMSSYYSK